MSFSSLIRCGCIAAVVFFCTSPAWAFKKESRIHLVGCRGHYAASGSATYVVTRGEPKVADHEATIIEVKNVPLIPGTTLIVYIADEPVGTIKLNANRGGSLKLSSELKQFAPPIDSGTSVVVKTIDGRSVMW